MATTSTHPHHADNTPDERAAAFRSAVDKCTSDQPRGWQWQYEVASLYADTLCSIADRELHEYHRIDAAYAAARLNPEGRDDLRDSLVYWLVLLPATTGLHSHHAIVEYMIDHVLEVEEIRDMLANQAPVWVDPYGADLEDARWLNDSAVEQWDVMRKLLRIKLTEVDTAAARSLVESGGFAFLADVTLDDITRGIIAPYITNVKFTPVRPPDEYTRTRSGTKRMREEQATKRIFVPRAMHE